MAKAQYAILRFAKYKGPEIGRIEAHNERIKEKYASNPDVDTSRSHLNFHLLNIGSGYRKEAERQIKDAGCRVRSDSVRVVEALITASPEFFKGKKKAEVREFFDYALDFMKQEQDPKTFISAVVHMDEATPHLHLSIVPLTADNRLSAKEILGNKKKLTQWQDRFWEHMVKKYPDLERGESASETGRDYIPPRMFKEMTHLTRQSKQLSKLLGEVSMFNSGAKVKEILAFLEKYIPDIEKMDTEMKKYRKTFDSYESEIRKLKKANKKLSDDKANLTEELAAAKKESTLKKLQDGQLRQKYEDAKALLDSIPPEIIKVYTQNSSKKQEVHHYR